MITRPANWQQIHSIQRALAILLLGTVGGCGPLPMNYLSTEGASADPVASLGWGLLGISLAVVAIISTLLLWAIFKRRPRPEPDAQGRIPLEPRGSQLYWIYVGVAISVVVLFATTVWTLKVLADIMHPPVTPAFTLQIDAHTWWWEARYQNGDASSTFTTANEIHIPVGKPVRVELTSQDVIHSFWVPQIAGKMDVVPGRTNVTWIEATAPGRYRGQCAEFCGLEHAHMAFYVVADAPEEFDRWWAHQLASAPSGLPGEQQFQVNCAACHSVRGTDALGIAGPNLSHLAARQTLASGTIPNDADHLDAWIQDPQAIKPGTTMPTLPLTASDRHHITTYLLSLK
jgi:cytochrome c oxidase subunit 2